MRSIRYLHTTRWLRSFASEPFDATSLTQRLDAKLTEKLTPDETLDALRACSKLEQHYIDSASPESPVAQTPVENAREILDKLLESEKASWDLNILHQYMVSTPPPSPQSSVKVLKAFQRDTRKHVPKQIAMIPFRRAVYNADFPNSFALVDATTNTFPYKWHIRRQWQKAAAYWTLGTGSILSGVELFLQSGMVGTWESTGMVHLMVLTYLASVTVYGGLAFGGRISGNGEVLKWSQGTLTTHWYSHAQEMKMCSLIADVNRNLPENQGECSLKLRQDLKHRKMATVELEDEAMLKEYWAKAGDGFEWVEPDQDPAEIRWREKADRTRNQRIGSSYSAQPNQNFEWADQVAKNGLPHASLVDTGNPKLLLE